MNRLPKNFWFNKYIITIIILCGSYYQTAAQNTFFIKISTWGTYFPEVFEDEKGCIIAKYDFGITRINPDGRILWKTRDKNLIKGTCIRDSQSYIFPTLATEMGGFAIQAIDYMGNMLWGAHENLVITDPFRTIYDFIIDSSRNQYIVSGQRSKVGALKYISYWIAGLDYRGKILWENYWQDSGQARYFARIFKNQKTKGYFLLAKDFDRSNILELINLDSLGQLLNRNPIEPMPCSINPNNGDYRLNDIATFDDSLFIASVFVRTSCSGTDGGYYYFYNSKGKLIKKFKHFWATSLVEQLNDKGILLGGGNFIAKLNKSFELKWSKQIIPDIENEFCDITSIMQSRDGGYIGIARCNNVANEYFVYVFKTDSLGNINQKEEYKERLQPVMLQPNPASNRVRIAIPYYFGKVSVEFYNMLGVFLFERTKDEQDMYDISSLASGMYIVKARVEETGEIRTMRLMVQ